MDQRRRTAASMALTMATFCMFSGQAAYAVDSISSTIAVDQAEYLFWLDESDMRSVLSSAKIVLDKIDMSAAAKDTNSLGQIYAAASQQFRGRYSLDAFSKKILDLRSQTGAVRKRVAQGVEGGFLTFPNFQDGHYAIAVFNVMLAKTKEIYTEQVTLEKDDATGRWRMVEYYFAPRPYYAM